MGMQLDVLNGACRAAVGAGVAHFLGINYKAGAAVGGLSAVVDKISEYVLASAELNNYFAGHAEISRFCKSVASTFASMYAINSNYVNKYFGAPLSLPQTFFIDAVSRMGDLVGHKIFALSSS